jgi:hypothetical protein
MAQTETSANETDVSETDANWAYRQQDNVGIWTIDDWGQLFEDGLAEAESHYKDTTARPEITAALVTFDSVDSLSSEMQEHITTVWSQLTQLSEVSKVGYVADGIAAMAVRANVEAPETELESFESVDEALSWARD